MRQNHELYVEHNGEKHGPFYPCNGPVPLHTFRQFPKSSQEKRADEISELAKALSVPLSVMTGKMDHSIVEQLSKARVIQQKQTFVPFSEDKPQEFENRLIAKQAVSHFLGRPLAELTQDQIHYINEVIDKSLNKQQVLSKIKNYFTLAVCQIGEK